MSYVVGIGAQKAGTTWLAEYFYEHDEVFMSPYKEMLYFDACHLPAHGINNWRQYWRRRHIDLSKYGPNNGIDTPEQSRDIHNLYLRTCMRSDKAYRDLLDYGAEGKLASCDMTPTYTDLDATGYAHMKKCLGDPKIIFLVRNPIDRFISQARMDRRDGKRRSYRQPMKLLQHHHYRKRGDYKRTLIELRKVFEPEKIHVAFYEKLFAPETRDSELKDICDFMGIGFRNPASRERSNAARDKSFSLDENQRREVARHYEPVMRYMEEYGTLPQSWIKDLESIAE